jgi:hypothetical protein
MGFILNGVEFDIEFLCRNSEHRRTLGEFLAETCGHLGGGLFAERRLMGPRAAVAVCIGY